MYYSVKKLLCRKFYYKLVLNGKYDLSYCFISKYNIYSLSLYSLQPLMEIKDNTVVFFFPLSRHNNYVTYQQLSAHFTSIMPHTILGNVPKVGNRILFLRGLKTFKSLPYNGFMLF